MTRRTLLADIVDLLTRIIRARGPIALRNVPTVAREVVLCMRRWFVARGKVGGASGTGQAKVRGDCEYYSKLGKASAQVRRKKKQDGH